MVTIKFGVSRLYGQDSRFLRFGKQECPSFFITSSRQNRRASKSRLPQKVQDLTWLTGETFHGLCGCLQKYGSLRPFKVTRIVKEYKLWLQLYFGWMQIFSSRAPGVHCASVINMEIGSHLTLWFTNLLHFFFHFKVNFHCRIMQLKHQQLICAQPWSKEEQLQI